MQIQFGFLSINVSTLPSLNFCRTFLKFEAFGTFETLTLYIEKQLVKTFVFIQIIMNMKSED